MSHPTRVRGLKFYRQSCDSKVCYVAPYTGAWIEITWLHLSPYLSHVAPYTGAWIEIKIRARVKELTQVAPYTGAWIEMCLV